MANITCYVHVYYDGVEQSGLAEVRTLYGGGTYTASSHQPSHGASYTLESIYLYDRSSGSYTDVTYGSTTVPNNNCDLDYFYTSPVVQTWSLSTANYGTITSKTSYTYSIGGYVMKRISVSFNSSGLAYFYSTGGYDTYGFLSTNSSFDSNNGAPTYPIAQNDDDTTGKTTGYNFGLSYQVSAGTTYYVWVRALYDGESVTCGIAVEPPAPPTGSIYGNAISQTSYSVTASNMQINPASYYCMFVADIDTSGNVTGYYCRYRAKPTSSTYTYNGTTSSAYSKHSRPVYLVYTDTAFTVGTKYQYSSFSGNIIASGYVPSIAGATVYVYGYKNGVWNFYPATVYVYSNGWKNASSKLFNGDWQ